MFVMFSAKTAELALFGRQGARLAAEFKAVNQKQTEEQKRKKKKHLTHTDPSD